jgi:ATP-dependent Clp protease ATP-binding subunit ClpC
LEVLSGLGGEGVSYLSLSDFSLRRSLDESTLSKLGESLLRIGAYRQSISIFEKLSKGGRSGSGSEAALYASHCYLGLQCYRKGRYAQSVLEFEKALRLRRDMPQLHYNLALAHARLKNLDKAISLLSSLVSEHPELDRGFELLGDLLGMKGDQPGAQRMYDRALLANPYNKSVERKRRRSGVEGAAGGKAASGAPSQSGQAKGAAEEPSALELLVDLTAEARAGMCRPLVGREAEISQLIEILCCNARSNPMLIGEPGVGKTAIVEELARRVVEQRVPPQLRDKKLFLMSVATLLAGAKFRGQFEERILGLVKQLKEQPCILFIDDIHTIVNAGLSKGGTLDTSNLLKPALVRGDIQAIGATNFDDFRNQIEKDPSLVRCFQLVQVEEPGPEETEEILASHLERLAIHHGVRFDRVDLSEIARLVAICLRERRLPDAALTVIDRAAARVALRVAEQPEYEREGPPLVCRDDMAAVISEMSNVPAAKLGRTETERFLNMEALLRERVVGQDEALSAVARVMRTTRLNLDIAPQRPNGVFLFVGPTGVGKTELARALAEFLFGDEERLIRIDMSEYMEKISSSRLIGAAPGYVGYNDQNQLTDQVRKQPYSLVLLDEIEKADAQMLNLFLQVFDAGRLTDGKGRTVHFANTTIVMTSNVGTELYGQSQAGYRTDGRRTRKVSRSELLKEIKRVFPPEFFNRLDEVVFFRPLLTEDLVQIARLQLSNVAERLERQGVKLRVSDAAYQLLVAEGASEEYGARNLARTLRRRVLDSLAQAALHTEWERVRQVLVEARDGQIEVSLRLEGELELESLELPASEQTDAEVTE